MNRWLGWIEHWIAQSVFAALYSVLASNHFQLFSTNIRQLSKADWLRKTVTSRLYDITRLVWFVVKVMWSALTLGTVTEYGVCIYLIDQWISVDEMKALSINWSQSDSYWSAGITCCLSLSLLYLPYGLQFWWTCCYSDSFSLWRSVT